MALDELDLLKQVTIQFSHDLMSVNFPFCPVRHYAKACSGRWNRRFQDMLFG